MKRTWLVAIIVAAPPIVAGACGNWNPLDENEAALPILDIEPSDNTGGLQALYVEVHGRPGTDWCLGVRMTSGSFDTAHENGRTSDCVRVPLVNDDAAAVSTFLYPVVIRLPMQPADPVLFATLHENPSGGNCVLNAAVDSGDAGQSACSGDWIRAAVWPPHGSTVSDAAVDTTIDSAVMDAPGDTSSDALDASDGGAG